jgi:hypothetical protein
MGLNFIGREEISCIDKQFPLTTPSILPEIPFSAETLKESSEDYILICGAENADPKHPLNIFFMRDFFGMSPEVSEPCFYNQDWYLSEEFVRTPLDIKWYLIKKHAIESTRSELPESVLKRNIRFPSTIVCAYTFFVYYFVRKEYLWYHDFVWCSDSDHNNDRIYVGKYNDVDNINKNGFSIHRHLSLRPCYGAIDIK